MAYSLSSFPLSWHITHFPHSVAESTHCAALGSFGTGGQSPRPDVPPSPLSVQGGGGGGGALSKSTVPKSTGSHCGGTATGWLTSANLLATLDLVMCGVKAAWKAAATLMRTSARKLEVAEVCCLAYRLRWGNL